MKFMEETRAPRRLTAEVNTMIKSKPLMPAIVFAVAVVTATGLWASVPVAIYGVITKVVIEPEETAPQRIQIWGAFAIENDSGRMLGPHVGYFYYTIPPGQEAITRKEWADLKSMAGTGQGVSFGARFAPAGFVRKEGVSPSSPDKYPIGNGVTKFSNGKSEPAIITQLKQTLKSRT